MTSPEIRPATSADAAAMARIWYLGWKDGHTGLVPDDLVAVRTEASFLPRSTERIGQTLVAIVGNEVAGFVTIAGDEVEQVYVDRDHRGTGIADSLMFAAEARIASHGHATAWLAVVAGNGRARAFYERNGWTDGGPFVYSASSASGPIEVPAHRYTKGLRTSS